nr:hypothetical protein GCM10020092_062140 [Actinoplanes digitatis]
MPSRPVRRTRPGPAATAVAGGYGYGSYYGGYYGYPYYGYGYGGYNVPVNICGNSVSVLGVSATQAACR